MTNYIAAVAVALALALVSPAMGHDRWASGEPVPSWVKAVCCGPQDVHHLRPEQVELKSDGYHIEGYPDAIPEDHSQPSLDGDFWAFYQEYPNGQFSKIYCFFVPFQGT